MNRILFYISIFLMVGCRSSKLPEHEYAQYNIGASVNISGDSLLITISNPVKAPLRAYLTSKDSILNKALSRMNPVLIAPLMDTTLQFDYTEGQKTGLFLQTKLGDPWEKISSIPFELPFPKGKTYKIIQGNDMLPTHNTSGSRYAIDFSLQKGDTVCAASPGIVVGVIWQYKRGGAGAQWKPFGNFITLFHPQSGLFSQYVHLRYKGSLVALGDTVQAGQPIGISGLTGQTNIEHLHFNVLRPSENDNGLNSVPVIFKEGYESKELQKRQIVTKN